MKHPCFIAACFVFCGWLFVLFIFLWIERGFDEALAIFDRFAEDVLK